MRRFWPRCLTYPSFERDCWWWYSTVLCRAMLCILSANDVMVAVESEGRCL